MGCLNFKPKITKTEIRDPKEGVCNYLVWREALPENTCPYTPDGISQELYNLHLKYYEDLLRKDVEPTLKDCIPLIENIAISRANTRHYNNCVEFDKLDIGNMDRNERLQDVLFSSLYIIIQAHATIGESKPKERELSPLEIVALKQKDEKEKMNLLKKTIDFEAPKEESIIGLEGSDDDDENNNNKGVPERAH